MTSTPIAQPHSRKWTAEEEQEITALLQQCPMGPSQRTRMYNKIRAAERINEMM